MTPLNTRRSATNNYCYKPRKRAKKYSGDFINGTNFGTNASVVKVYFNGAGNDTEYFCYHYHRHCPIWCRHGNRKNWKNSSAGNRACIYFLRNGFTSTLVLSGPCQYIK